MPRIVGDCLDVKNHETETYEDGDERFVPAISSPLALRDENGLRVVNAGSEKWTCWSHSS